MLPTTRAQTAQQLLKQSTAQYHHAEKERMFQTVKAALELYCVNTGKSEETARHELFTIVRLNTRKRTLCARDIYFSERLRDINKGMCSHSIWDIPELILHQTSPRDSVSTL